MKKYLPLALIILLCACSDENNPQPSTQPGSPSALHASSDVLPVSSAAIALADPASAVINTQSMPEATGSTSINTEIITPDSDTIIQWAQLDEDDENIKVELMLPILLMDGEKAFVAKISRFQGRNDMYGAYLVRPTMKEAREISTSVQDIKPIPKLIRDADKLVFIEIGGSGQGDEGYGDSLVYFKGWDAVVLYERNYLNSEACMNYPDQDAKCTRNEVSWEYLADKNDLLLKETVVSAEWKNPSACTATANRSENTYRISNLKLTTESTNKTSTTLQVDPDCKPRMKKKAKTTAD